MPINPTNQPTNHIRWGESCPSLVMQTVYSTAPYVHVIYLGRGARGAIVIVVGNGHGDTSSNPERDWLDFT